MDSEVPAEADRQRLAAIDIGSNSLRLVVATPIEGGHFRIIDEERESTRLAGRLHATGRLDPDAVERTIAALARFAKLATAFDATRVETIATCAVREAANGEEFVRRVEAETGLEVRVISAETEALYAFRSVQAAFDIADRNIAVADIGGGSTEIVYASGGHIEKIYSTRLGAVRLTDRFSHTERLFDADARAIQSAIREELKLEVRHRPFTPECLYGTGGTFTALASLLIAMRGEDPHMIWGYRVTRADVRHLFDRLSCVSLRERRQISGLSDDRADIIVAGMAIVDGVMQRLGTNVLRVHNGGVRDGLLLTLMDDIPGRQRSVDRNASVRNFARSCGTDTTHSDHVAHLAGRIYDDLVQLGLAMDGDKELLRTAAILQDVGYLIDYKQHHKHSYQLIVNSRLPGIRRDEIELIANIARYHRGSEPKKKHANFRKLGRSDRHRVRLLAGILRIAGGLDRGHCQRVRDVLTTKDSRNQIHIELSSSDTDPELELWASRNRTQMLEHALGRRIVITRIPEELGRAPAPTGTDGEDDASLTECSAGANAACLPRSASRPSRAASRAGGVDP